ncbi:unnamed protein product [Somion occarium]|uniref:Uncharacterized protein n=1 Tax=Somion occarium TaxID=3059160 RepID=A0ABP1CPC3_9APHY
MKPASFILFLSTIAASAMALSAANNVHSPAATPQDSRARPVVGVTQKVVDELNASLGRDERIARAYSDSVFVRDGSDTITDQSGALNLGHLAESILNVVSSFLKRDENTARSYVESLIARDETKSGFADQSGAFTNQLPKNLQEILPQLIEEGIFERVSRAYMDSSESGGVYARGLDAYVRSLEELYARDFMNQLLRRSLYELD